MSCHSGLKSSWELVFLQAVGRIGEPIDLRQRRNKLTLLKGAVQLLSLLLRWSQLVQNNYVLSPGNTLLPLAEYKINFLGCSNLLEYPVWEFFELPKGWSRGQQWAGPLLKRLELIDAYPIFCFVLVFNLSPVLGECFAKSSLVESTNLGCRTEMFLAGVVALGVLCVPQRTHEGRLEALLCLKTVFALLAKAALLEGRWWCKNYRLQGPTSLK